MDKNVFNKISDIIYKKSGIALGDNKESLVSARLSKRMRALNIHDHKEYLNYLVNEKTGEELVQLLDVISTNVTSFFRENHHFDFLSIEIAKWLKKGQRRFRIWSSASSTGEEPYTIAMTLLETFGVEFPDVKILATDISTKVLNKCLEGIYSEEKLKDVPKLLKDKYFIKLKKNDEIFFEVKENLRKMILFRRLNLSTTPFPMKGPMDVIFCRNVMIYFDNKVRKKLLDEFYRLLKPGGFLMVGHAESLTGLMCSLKAVSPSIYVKA